MNELDGEMKMRKKTTEKNFLFIKRLRSRIFWMKNNEKFENSSKKMKPNHII